jgi:hypothetical protein
MLQGTVFFSLSSTVCQLPVVFMTTPFSKPLFLQNY